MVSDDYPVFETDRLVAWDRELRAVHGRLRDALELARSALERDAQSASRELLLYCHGFCAALDGHHRGEDALLFPAIEAAHPELSETLRALERDHSMIAQLLGALRSAVDRSATQAELQLHLEGVGAIMENHFRYEERRLDTLLSTLRLDASVLAVFGPL